MHPFYNLLPPSLYLMTALRPPWAALGRLGPPGAAWGRLGPPEEPVWNTIYPVPHGDVSAICYTPLSNTTNAHNVTIRLFHYVAGSQIRRLDTGGSICIYILSRAGRAGRGIM